MYSLYVLHVYTSKIQQRIFLGWVGFNKFFFFLDSGRRKIGKTRRRVVLGFQMKSELRGVSHPARLTNTQTRTSVCVFFTSHPCSIYSSIYPSTSSTLRIRAHSSYRVEIAWCTSSVTTRQRHRDSTGYFLLRSTW